MTIIRRFLPLVLYTGLSLLLWRFTIDDNFISFRYARNLALGHGLVWNVGEQPVEGFSNFLWVLILATIGRFGIDIPLAAKIISFLIGGAIVWMLPKFSEKFTGSTSWTWVPSLLLSLSVPWILWAVAGGEVMLFSLFFLLVVWELLEEGARPLRFSIACVGMILTRPDGLMYVAVALASALVYWRSRRQWFQRLWMPLVCSVAAFAGVEAFRIEYFGDWMPNTLRAKVVSSFPGLPLVGLWALVALPFLALLAWMYWAKRARLSVVVIGAVVLVNAIAVAHTSIVMNLIQRYHTFLLPALLAASPFLLCRINARKLAIMLIVGAIGWSATAWPNAYQYWRQERFMCQYREEVSGVLSRDVTAPSRLALVDVGIIGYRTGLPIVDIWGLCNARIAREGFSIKTLLREDSDDCLLSVRCQTDSSGLKITPAFGLDWALVTDSVFKSQYVSTQVLRPDMVGSEPWEFYYVLLHRKS